MTLLCREIWNDFFLLRGHLDYRKKQKERCINTIRMAAQVTTIYAVPTSPALWSIPLYLQEKPSGSYLSLPCDPWWGVHIKGFLSSPRKENLLSFLVIRSQGLQTWSWQQPPPHWGKQPGCETKPMCKEQKKLRLTVKCWRCPSPRIWLSLRSAYPLLFPWPGSVTKNSLSYLCWSELEFYDLKLIHGC